MPLDVGRAEVIGWFKDLPLELTPGEKFAYSNSGFYLLGIIIEKVSGLSYGEYIEKNIFKPFGMKHSGFMDFQTIIPNRAQGYISNGDTLINATTAPPLVPFSAGGLVSTVQDLRKYIDTVHKKPGILSPFVRDLILRQGRLSDGTLLKYTLGGRNCREMHGHKKYGHPGMGRGFSSVYTYYPVDDLSIVILINHPVGDPSPLSLEQQIAGCVLGIEPIH